MKCTIVDRLVSHYFRSLGWFVGKKPGYFIVVPLLMSVSLSFGLLKMNYVKDAEYLFIPTDGPSQHERNVTESIFPMNLSNNFDESRITRFCPFSRILIEAKKGKSIFDIEVFQDLKAIDSMVRNITVRHNQEQWNYESMCARKNDKCFENKIFHFKDRLDDMMDGNYTIEYPLMIDDDFNVFFSGAILGGVITDEFNMIQSAAAVSLFYFLQHGENARTWEDSFLQVMEDTELEHIHFAYFTSQTMSEELDTAKLSALPLVSLAVAIMLVFSALSCMMSDCVKSKPWLGVLGCVSTVAAVGAAFGFTAFCGLEFIGINVAALFLVLGIGMDDTFVLLAAWRRMDDRQRVPERLADAYAEAGVTITISSLTNMLSFLTGIITPFPCIRIFCIYTAVAVLFTYIYHITLFGGCMALLGYAEHQNLHSFICQPAVPKSLAHKRSKCFRFFCTGGKNLLDPDNPWDNQENMMMKFFRDKFGVYLSNPRIKFPILVIFLLYLTFGIWGCITLKDGLEKHDIVSYDSYALEYYFLEQKYFRNYYLKIQVVINETLDYSDPGVQNKVNNLISKMENSSLMAGPRFTESWLRFYQSFLNDSRTKTFIQEYDVTNNKEHFYLLLKGIFLPFTRHHFNQDIKFNDNFTEVTASRFVLQSRTVLDSQDMTRLISKLREIARDSEFSVTICNHLFIIYDQFLVLKSMSVQSIGVATTMMLIVLFIFIPNLGSVLWVGFSILSIEIGVIGFMNWWNVYLNSVSMINVIMCIGFSVDYLAHISYAYISSGEKEPNVRMGNALYSLGLPILQSSVSTLLGIIVLPFFPSYILLVFFKTVFLVIVLATFHGLILLPVMLSLTDGWYTNKKDIEATLDNKCAHTIHRDDTKMQDYGTIPSLIQYLSHSSEIRRDCNGVFTEKPVNGKKDLCIELCKENGQHFYYKNNIIDPSNFNKTAQKYKGYANHSFINDCELVKNR